MYDLDMTWNYLLKGMLKYKEFTDILLKICSYCWSSGLGNTTAHILESLHMDAIIKEKKNTNVIARIKGYPSHSYNIHNHNGVPISEKTFSSPAHISNL